MTDLLAIESKVYTKIKNNLSDTFKAKYPNTYITTSDKRPTTMNYPYVYVHDMGGTEGRRTLANDTIVGVYSSFQIEVYSDKSQTVTTDTMREIIRIMKTMRFSISTMPENFNTDSLYRKVARFERLICDGDTL